jgi:hypothetical protein
MGFSGGFEQGKPETALPGLKGFISVNVAGVNPPYDLAPVFRNEISGEESDFSQKLHQTPCKLQMRMASTTLALSG